MPLSQTHKEWLLPHAKNLVEERTENPSLCITKWTKDKVLGGFKERFPGFTSEQITVS